MNAKQPLNTHQYRPKGHYGEGLEVKNSRKSLTFYKYGLSVHIQNVN